jgi:uncharacterized protein
VQGGKRKDSPCPPLSAPALIFYKTFAHWRALRLPYKKRNQGKPMTLPSSDIRVTPRKILMPLTLFGILSIVGLTMFGAMLTVAIQEYKKDNHLLTIKGLFEEVVRADRAHMSFTISVAGSRLDTLYAETEKHTRQLHAYLIQSGLDEKDVSIGVPNLTDNKARHAHSDRMAFLQGAQVGAAAGPAMAENPSSDRLSTDASPSRYFLNISVNVASPKVDLCQKLLQNSGAFLSLGIPIVQSNIEYEYSKFTENRIGMLEKAFQNAKEAAKSFAFASGAKLGGIHHAGQGQFSIENAETSQPYGSSIDKKIRVVVYVSYFIKTDEEDELALAKPASQKSEKQSSKKFSKESSKASDSSLKVSSDAQGKARDLMDDAHTSPSLIKAWFDQTPQRLRALGKQLGLY